MPLMRKGALLVVAITEAMSLGLLKSPGACGADIVVAEGQSFGVPLSFGGPYVGLFATREKYARQIPGRLVGEAYDKKGRRGFVLTLATREQHIRREKATSNICTNEGLIALAATVYLETMGRRGVQEAAHQCAQKAAYAARAIAKLNGYSLAFTGPYFNEFVVRGPDQSGGTCFRVWARRKRLMAGSHCRDSCPDRPNDFLVCVTEINSREQIDAFAAGLSGIQQRLSKGYFLCVFASSLRLCVKLLFMTTAITKVTTHISPNEQLIFERSQTGRIGYRLPALDVDEVELEHSRRVSS